MMYTNTRPTYQGDRIDLFPDAKAAQAAGGNGMSPYRVAVRFDARERRVIPLWTHPSVIDPSWTALAEAHADGSVTARGPIPSLLFTD
ncbi:MAG TPA: hypothetical protein VGZ22_01545 [Isosphaeraceae bacterium]|jgi:hypothetical protein|nr:hypothetical protein [Isosphaeraceae bacterium]